MGAARDSLAGQVVIVTGAGRGIGRETALYLASMGSEVYCVDPGLGRDGRGEAEEVGDEVVRTIEASGGVAWADSSSVSSLDEAKGIFEAALAKAGRVDAVVNCHGILREKMVWNMSEEDWRDVVTVHLHGTFNMCRHAAEIFRGSRSGRIVNMVSTAWLGSVGQSNYSAAKGGIVSLTYSLARELGRYGVTANAVCPSAATRMTRTPEVLAGLRQRYERGLISKRKYEQALQAPGPEHIPPLVAFLLSDAAADVNGQVFKSHRGHIGRYSAPEEVRVVSRVPGAELFTLDEIEDAFESTLLDGYVNPSPAARPEDSRA